MSEIKELSMKRFSNNSSGTKQVFPTNLTFDNYEKIIDVTWIRKGMEVTSKAPLCCYRNPDVTLCMHDVSLNSSTYGIYEFDRNKNFCHSFFLPGLSMPLSISVLSSHQTVEYVNFEISTRNSSFAFKVERKRLFLYDSENSCFNDTPISDDGSEIILNEDYVIEMRQIPKRKNSPGGRTTRNKTRGAQQIYTMIYEY